MTSTSTISRTSLIATFIVWSVFTSAVTLAVELLPAYVWVGALAYSTLIAGYACYDTILYERFTPPRNFYLAFVGIHLITFVIRFLYQELIPLEPQPIKLTTVSYFFFSLVISNLLYLFLYRLTKRK